MKKLIAIFVSFLMLTPLLGMGGGQSIVIKHKSGGHSFTQVQALNACLGSPTFTCTLPNNVTTGNVVILGCFINQSGGTTVPAPTMPSGTSYISPTSTSFNFMTEIVGGTGNTITFTSVPATVMCGGGEFSGVYAGAPEQNVGQSGAYWNNSGTHNLLPVTTTGANDEICASVSAAYTPEFSPGTGYTTIQLPTSSIYAVILECGNSIVSAGTYTPTVSIAQSGGIGGYYSTMAFVLN